MKRLTLTPVVVGAPQDGIKGLCGPQYVGVDLVTSDRDLGRRCRDGHHRACVEMHHSPLLISVGLIYEVVECNVGESAENTLSIIEEPSCVLFPDCCFTNSIKTLLAAKAASA
jgi:hypothetical protein